jgi:hypothetical protein
MPLLNTSRKRVCEGLQVAIVVRVASEPVTSIRSNWMNNGQLRDLLSDAGKSSTVVHSSSRGLMPKSGCDSSEIELFLEVKGKPVPYLCEHDGMCELPLCIDILDTN